MSSWLEEIDVAHGGVWRLQLLMERVLFEGRSDFQSIVVFENRLFGRVLALDGIIQTTDRDEFFYHEMAVQVPMLAHGAVKRALIIGGGDGGALEESLKHPDLESVTMVEIDGTVVEVAKQHLRKICGAAFEDPRTNLIIADGVQYLADCSQRFDFILIDSTDPIGLADSAPQGPGAVLFSEDFYRSCKACMSPGAVLVTQNAVPFVEALSSAVKRNGPTSVRESPASNATNLLPLGGSRIFSAEVAQENLRHTTCSQDAPPAAHDPLAPPGPDFVQSARKRR